MSSTKEESPFIGWPTAALARRLQLDGLEISTDVSGHDLVGLAEEFYKGRAMPERPEVQKVVFKDRAGNEFVARPPRYARLLKDPNCNERFYDGYLYCEGDSYLPPMSKEESRAGAGLTGEYNEHLFRSNTIPGAPVTLGHLNYVRQSGALTSYDQLDAESERWLSPPRNGRSQSKGAVLTEKEVRENPDMFRKEYLFIQPEDTAQRIQKEFQVPSKETAQLYADLNHPRDRNGKPYNLFKTRTGRFCNQTGCIWKCFNPFSEGSTSDFARYGQGISLYFKFLKWGYWTFFILTILALPQMVINAGTNGPQEVVSGVLSTTTLGNLVQYVYSLNETVINSTLVNVTITRTTSSAAVELPLTGSSVSRAELGDFYTLNDLVISLVFFLSVLWLRSFEAQENLNEAKCNLSVEEYSVFVESIPPLCTEEELSDFFSDLTSEPVADVFIAQDNGNLIRLYVERGKVIDKLWKAAARVHFLKNEMKVKENKGYEQLQNNKVLPPTELLKHEAHLSYKLREAINLYDWLLARYQHLTNLRNKYKRQNKAVAAFVTFETQAGYLRCLDVYSKKGYKCRKQSPLLQFQSKTIKVSPAPPPSTVKWENLGIPLRSQYIRHGISILVMMSFLALSFLTSYLAARYGQAITFSQETCQIQEGEAEILFQFYNIGATDNVSPSVLACFCQTLSYQDLFAAIISSSNSCHTYWVSQSKIYGYSILSTVVVALANYLIEILIQALSTFEMHSSLISTELSVGKRIFFLQFFNTAFALLAVNAKYPSSPANIELYSDFTPDWYSNVGSEIVAIMLFNILAIHSSKIFSLILFNFRKKYAKASSQRELNEKYLGPVFHLSLRIAQTMSLIFVTMLYSSGIPILYPLAAVSFLLFYWFDKVLFIRLYRTPPNYSNKLSHWASGILWIASLIHLMFATWMYSAQGIFATSGNKYVIEIGARLGVNSSFLADEKNNYVLNRLTMDHILPLVLAIILLLLYKSVFIYLFSILKPWLCFCKKVFCCRTLTKTLYLNPNFSDAKANDEIRGLDSYNILRNPIYGRSFGVSDAFAGHHRHVTSVNMRQQTSVSTIISVAVSP